MKRLFYSMVGVFVAVSMTGMFVTILYLYHESESTSLLIDSNLSLLKRSELAAQVEKLREEVLREMADRDMLISAAEKTRIMLNGCGGCHHGDSGKEKIGMMISLVKVIKEGKAGTEEVRSNVIELHGHAHEAMSSGQRLVNERVHEAINYARKSWGLFIVILIIGLGVMFSLALFFIRRFDRNVKNIIMATEAVRRGERIDHQMFGRDYRSIGDSIHTMQSELIIKEEKLINWAKQWQTAFNSVDSMMALCGTDGSVIIANDAFNNVFARDGELEGISLKEIVCFEERDDDGCALTRTLKEGQPYSGMSTYKDMILSVKTYPVRSEGGGEISGGLWIGRDITKEKELEERAIQSEKLVALGELVAGIAHEVNNPLSAVVGFSEILKDSENLEHEDRQKIEKIYSAAIRVSKIIRNLLEFSRKRPSEFGKHNINDMAEKVLELMEYELHVDNINIDRNFTDVPDIICDVTQIQQVVLNLANNAHHAIAEKGGGGIISLKTFHNSERVSLAMSDTGIGIPEDIVSRIFEPFYTTKDVGKGTGLGLSIVYSSVRSHGGDIEIHSVPGEGSTFTISLPIKPPRE